MGLNFIMLAWISKWAGMTDTQEDNNSHIWIPRMQCSLGATAVVFFSFHTEISHKTIYLGFYKCNVMFLNWNKLGIFHISFLDYRGFILIGCFTRAISVETRCEGEPQAKLCINRSCRQGKGLLPVWHQPVNTSPHLLYQPKETSPGEKPRRHQRRKEETAKRKEQARERKTYVTLPEEFLLLSSSSETLSI